MDPLLDIKDHLGGLDIRQFTFVRPEKDKEVVLLLEDIPTGDAGPGGTVSIMTLESGTIVGFREHLGREIVYEKIGDAAGDVTLVIMMEKGESQHHELVQDARSPVVWAGLPHAIVVAESNEPILIRVTELPSFARHAEPGVEYDYVYQENYDRLTMNKHKIPDAFFLVEERSVK